MSPCPTAVSAPAATGCSAFTASMSSLAASTAAFSFPVQEIMPRIISAHLPTPMVIDVQKIASLMW